MKQLTFNDLLWILPILAGATAIVIWAIRELLYLRNLKTEKPKFIPDKKTIDLYGYVPKADAKNVTFSRDTKQCCVGLLLFLLIGLTGKAQLHTYAGAGMTNKYFSAELQVGYRLHNTALSIGYIALPDRTQPVLFNIRINQLFSERWQVYAGYVREQYSLDDKSRNNNRWQLGGQYHALHFDGGTVYIGSTYTNGVGVSGHVGMSYNLFRIGS